MPRRIGENVRNELKIYDSVSDSIIRLYYRLPTTNERLQYVRDSVEMVDGKFQTNIIKARQKWGPEILLGFEDGGFQKKSGDEWTLFSSDPGSPNFDPEWKPQIKKYAPDLLEALAEHIFEGQKTFGIQSENPEKN